MIHLISIAGKSARNFYLRPECISNFKSLMRTLISGRVMLISTKFQSDLFYFSEKRKKKSILKLWSMYADTHLSKLDKKDLSTSKGGQKALSIYFQSINKLSTNWLYYRLYRRAFFRTFSLDKQNPVANTIVQCDQYLVQHTEVNRTPLLITENDVDTKFTEDTFSIAMDLLNNDNLAN